MYRNNFSHIEIESLPTGNWGYEHFPVSARYVETLGMDYLGMTGKFHPMWGEVGGYKKPEALVYECGAMLAQGARCSIGDHLHPSGMMVQSTYSGVAQAYAHVEACEPWIKDSTNRAEGVFTLSPCRGSGDGRNCRQGNRTGTWPGTHGSYVTADGRSNNASSSAGARHTARDILHFLHATPVQRGTSRGDQIQPIQDIVPPHDIACSIECDSV